MRRVTSARSDAEPTAVVDALSNAVLSRLSGAVLGAVEKALSDAVLDALVVRLVGRVSARVSGAGSALRCGERKKRCFAALSMTSNPCHSERSEESSVQRRPRKHVLRPDGQEIGHESAKPTKGKMRVGHTPHRTQFLGHERGLGA